MKSGSPSCLYTPILFLLLEAANQYVDFSKHELHHFNSHKFGEVPHILGSIQCASRHAIGTPETVNVHSYPANAYKS